VTDSAPRHDPTRDSLWGGALTLWQPARGHGYRFNLDPVLLSGFASAAEHVLDLGAGVGVLGVLLLAAKKAARVTAVEIQSGLADLARRNAAANAELGPLFVVDGDCRVVALPRVDAVVFNPPYFKCDAGRAAPESGRDAGRRERHGTLADFVACAAAVLLPGGTIAAIVPAARGAELESLLREVGATALRRRLVVPRLGAPAGHCLLEATVAGRPSAGAHSAPLLDEPALVVHVGAGREFSPEVRAYLRMPVEGA